jgi:autotransporter-associated beta strand protein
MSGCTFLLLAASSLWTVVAIDGGTYYLAPGVQSQLQVRISGGDPVSAVKLWVQIGDGGAANQGTNTAPVINSINLVGPGTIFNASNTGATPVFAGGLMAVAETTTDVARAATVPANGTLSLITINTAGAPAGETVLHLKGVAANVFPTPQNTSLTVLTGSPPSQPLPVPATITDGRIVVLHTMTWKGGNGNWTAANWLDSASPASSYPSNDSADVVVPAGTVTANAASFAHSLAVSGTGGLSLSWPAGTLTLANRLTLGSGAATGTGSISGNATLTATSLADTLTITSPLSGTGPLTKTGAGKAVLSGANNYTGGTVVSAGTLEIAQAGSVPTGSGLTIGAGAKVVLQVNLTAEAATEAMAGVSRTVPAMGNTVPEPGAASLLAAGIAAGFAVWLARSRTA